MACTLSDGDVQEVESNCKTQKPDLQQALFFCFYTGPNINPESKINPKTTGAHSR